MSEESGGGAGRPGLAQRLVMPLLLATMAGAGIVASFLHHQNSAPPPPEPTTATASTVPIHSTEPPARVETAADGLGGLLFAGAPAPQLVTLARSDPDAGRGPWSVLLRLPDGSLGRHGAVLIYPVEALGEESSPQVGTPGDAAPAARTLVWRLGNGHARIRGDLPQATLLAIARGTTVVQGHPRVVTPPGLAVVAEGPYRPPLIHEARYGTRGLGEVTRLGDSLAYTGLTSQGGFEDMLFALGGRPAGRVNNAPAVLSSVGGGSATLAWQPAQGLVAYVGYSGISTSAEAEAGALHALADRTRLLSPAEWLATHPQLSEQVNGF